MNEVIILKSIGLRIRKIREENNLTIQQLSDKIDMEYNNLIRIEKGRTNPTILTLLKISQALNVKLIHLVDVE